LIEASERPSTTIQVLPFSLGAHTALAGQFSVLDFDDNITPAHVFCDGLTGGILRSRDEDVRRYRLCFEELTNIALDPAESVEMISAFARGDRGE
jgi:Domain of unknown function (DUF5753)